MVFNHPYNNHTPPLYFLKTLVEVSRVFKGVFVVMVTDKQHFHIIDWRNTLENLNIFPMGLVEVTWVVKGVFVVVVAD